MSAISVPLRDDRQLAGALALVFFSSAMSMDEAVERYLPDLKATACSIGEAIGSSRSAVGTRPRAPRASAERAGALPA